MKYSNFIFLLGSLVLIAGAVLKIMHWEYANFLLYSSFFAMTCYQIWCVSKLQKQKKELEK